MHTRSSHLDFAFVAADAIPWAKRIPDYRRAEPECSSYDCTDYPRMHTEDQAAKTEYEKTCARYHCNATKEQ
jgi:hypothetical protein